MTRQYWKPANLLNPLPVVLVTSTDGNGHDNVMTAAWAGTICSDPVMVSVSIRKSRYSHELISKTKEFVINMPNTKMALETDYCGIYSGRKVDKFNLPANLHLTRVQSKQVKAPSILEAPVSLECVVKEIKELGSHDMFIAEVVGTSVDDSYLDENGRLDLNKADLLAYSHGEYRSLGKVIGKFGYSSKKEEKKKRRKYVNKKKQAG